MGKNFPTESQLATLHHPFFGLYLFSVHPVAGFQLICDAIGSFRCSRKLEAIRGAKYSLASGRRAFIVKRELEHFVRVKSQESG